MSDENTLPDHLQIIDDGDGPRAMPIILAANGGNVRLYDSTSMPEPHLWAKATRRGAESIWLQLSAPDAWRLSEQLQFMVENHPQGQSSLPAWVRRAITAKSRKDEVHEPSPET